MQHFACGDLNFSWCKLFARHTSGYKIIKTQLFIMGGAGTGKTSVLLALIGIALMRNKSVLVTAQGKNVSRMKRGKVPGDVDSKKHGLLLDSTLSPAF